MNKTNELFQSYMKGNLQIKVSHAIVNIISLLKGTLKEVAALGCSLLPPGEYIFYFSRFIYLSVHKILQNWTNRILGGLQQRSEMAQGKND